MWRCANIANRGAVVDVFAPTRAALRLYDNAQTICARCCGSSARRALLDADRLADVAENLGVTLSTVRTHLQRTFEKTDTRRQSELVRLLLAHRPPVDLIDQPTGNGALAATPQGTTLSVGTA
jgi:hypothetical protein